MHRWTMKELAEVSDRNFILQTLRDRRESCTNIYSPLYEYIRKLLWRVETTGC